MHKHCLTWWGLGCRSLVSPLVVRGRITKVNSTYNLFSINMETPLEGSQFQKQGLPVSIYNRAPSSHFNVKTVFSGVATTIIKIRWSWDCLVSYTRVYETSAGGLRLICLVYPGVRDKRRVSEIDLSQPRHETAFWWRHNGSVTSQLTDPIKWPNYPLELIGIYVNINTHNKEFLQQRCRRSTNVRLCLIFLYISIWFEA